MKPNTQTKTRPEERPKASSTEALARMQRQRRRDTVPEMALRSELHRRGRRYRVHYRLQGTRRTADISFPASKVAVFVDGCFWHGCPEHGTKPKANRAWWRAKIAANISRDRDTDAKLAQLGWRSVRVWEHERPAEAADRIEAALGAHGAGSAAPGRADDQAANES